METNILKILKDGLKISLMDGSKWKLVNFGDMTKTIIWYPPQRIQIEKNNNGQFFLINLDTYLNEKVEVSRIY